MVCSKTEFCVFVESFSEKRGFSGCKFMTVLDGLHKLEYKLCMFQVRWMFYCEFVSQLTFDSCDYCILYKKSEQVGSSCSFLLLGFVIIYY